VKSEVLKMGVQFIDHVIARVLEMRVNRGLGKKIFHTIPNQRVKKNRKLYRLREQYD